MHCRHCSDIVRLYDSPRSCHCQRSRGWYVDDTHVFLSGPCRAIGLDTREVARGSRGIWEESDRVLRRKEDET